MRILLAEDEKELSAALCVILEYNHYSVDAVYDGKEAMDHGLCENYDCIILDIMMPKMDGLSVLQRLRSENVMTPVLLLTAKSELDDRVIGLDTGADDYLSKPVAMAELLARLRAMTRRTSEFLPNMLINENINLNRSNFELSNGETAFCLGNKEFKMMELLMSAYNRYITSEQIRERIWGNEHNFESGVIEVYISYLRKKLVALEAKIEIKKIDNFGYCLETRI